MNQPCVLAIGSFDGVHRGHAQLISYAYNRAQQIALPLVALTFDPLPGEYFRQSSPNSSSEPSTSFFRIGTVAQRIELLTGLGVNRVTVQAFTTWLQQLSPEEFVTKIVLEQEQAREVIVGNDFRFGSNRSGNRDTLQALCSKHQVRFHAFSLIKHHNTHSSTKYSSSSIRQALAAGDLSRVNDLLGYSWQMTGRVEHGDGRGAGLGFATANIAPCLPLPNMQGVFVASLRVDNAWKSGIANIGQRPTFNGEGRRCEVHLLSPPERSLYQADVTLALHSKLRNEQRFGNPEALQHQIALDIEQARAWHTQHGPHPRFLHPQLTLTDHAQL